MTRARESGDAADRAGSASRVRQTGPRPQQAGGLTLTTDGQEVAVNERDSPVVRLADMHSLGELAGTVSGVRSGDGALEALERQRSHDEAFFRDRQGFAEDFLEDFPAPMPRCVGRTAGDEAR
jgi:hypothetical protein